MHFQRFQNEHPELEETLRIGLMSIGEFFTAENTRPFDANLYEAYKIMRSYGVSDNDLFS